MWKLSIETNIKTEPGKMYHFNATIGKMILVGILLTEDPSLTVL